MSKGPGIVQIPLRFAYSIDTVKNLLIDVDSNSVMDIAFGFRKIEGPYILCSRIVCACSGAAFWIHCVPTQRYLRVLEVSASGHLTCPTNGSLTSTYLVSREGNQIAKGRNVDLSINNMGPYKVKVCVVWCVQLPDMYVFDQSRNCEFAKLSFKLSNRGQ